MQINPFSLACLFERKIVMKKIRKIKRQHFLIKPSALTLWKRPHRCKERKTRWSMNGEIIFVSLAMENSLAFSRLLGSFAEKVEVNCDEQCNPLHSSILRGTTTVSLQSNLEPFQWKFRTKLSSVTSAWKLLSLRKLHHQKMSTSTYLCYFVKGKKAFYKSFSLE